MRMTSGTYVGDGNDDRDITGLGFQPDLVIIKGDVAQPASFRSSTMPPDATKSLVDDTALLPNLIQSFQADGFTIGAAAAANQSGVDYSWVAFEAAPGEMALGSYVGDGSDDRSVGGVGFRPDYLVIASEGADHAWQRTSSMVGDASVPFRNNALASNRIQALEPDGFQVGSDAKVNASGVVHHYAAWKSVPPHMSVGWYTGDSNDDRNITGLGYAPEYLIIKADSGERAAHRAESIGPVDETLQFHNVANTANLIQSLDADGFQVGSDNQINDAGKVYYWVGFNTTLADLSLAKVVDVPEASEGDTLTYTLTLSNLGPDGATAIAVADTLPAGLTFASAAASQGAYTPGTGIWTVGDVGAGAGATLALKATVDAGMGGTIVTNRARISVLTEIDPIPDNDADAVDVVVTAVDLELTKAVDLMTPSEGDTLRYTLALRNLGPSNGTGIAVADTLPAGLTFVAATPSRGAYDPATGAWTVGGLDAGENAQLLLAATVDAGTGGGIITNRTRISALDQHDPQPANDADSIAVSVMAFADLELTKIVDSPTVSEGDTLAFTLTLANLGPNDATAVAVADTLPPGLSFASSTPSQGSYDPGTGIWSIGDVVVAGTASLILEAIADAGTGGSLLTNIARVAASEQTDDDPANDVDSVGVTVTVVDLAVTKTVDDASPIEGENVTYTIALVNLGPDDATGVSVADMLPEEVTFVSASATRGSYDDATGAWVVGAVAAGSSATLWITATVDGGTGGATIVNTAGVSSSDQADAVFGNDVDSIEIFPIDPASTTVLLLTENEGGAVATPGQARRVLEVDVANRTPSMNTLRAITLTNATIGPGTRAELDSEWDSITLYLAADREALPKTLDSLVTRTGRFAGGAVTFDGLDAAVDSGDTLHVLALGEISQAARDGDLLRVVIDGANAVDFVDPVDLDATWPVASNDGFVIDGMVADQIRVRPVGAGVFGAGSTRNLAFDVVLPANGYQPDVLNRINVVNLGNASPMSDIAGMEIWVDDGDSIFSAASDERLGAFSFTGDRWEVTGLARAVPVEGLHLFVTVDLTANAFEGRTLRLGLPTLPDVGVGMRSNNDGPVDRTAYNPYAQTISSSDRVVLTTAIIDSGTTFPGEHDIELLHVLATNTYDVARRLTGITIRNATSGSGSPDAAELDGEMSELQIRLDGNGNGVLDDYLADPIVRTATFEGGQAAFIGLSWDLPAGTTRHLFITGDVSISSAADGDVIATMVAGSSDVRFDVATAVVASWPLDSGARWLVDGMVAAQIDHREIDPAGLAAGDGPHLAMDVRMPRNGYADDTLEGLEIVNLGSATTADIADLRLWRDGGDDVFSAGGGDDVELGPIVFIAGRWKSPLLAESVGETGLHLFIGLTVSMTPADSSTVRLAIPIGGVTMDSGNDGPIDAAVANASALLLSNAPLLPAITFDAGVSTLGQTVTVRMNVRNVGGEDVTAIAPSALVPSGHGTLVFASGPSPPSIDLATGESGEFVWTYTAVSIGEVRFSGSAAGTGAVSGLPRQSLQTTSSAHRVLIPVVSMELFAVANMPFSINRGQTDVVPLTLTLRNPAGANAADIALHAFRLRLEDEAGIGIVPAEQLTRVVVREGANKYFDSASLPASGDEIDLRMATPVLVTGREPVTLGIRLDISATATAPSFRVVIADSTWFDAYDDVSGARVDVELQDGDYPIQSGLGRLVAEATELRVSQTPEPARSVGPGQSDVTLMKLELENVGVDDISSAVVVGGLAVSLVGDDGSVIPEPRVVLKRLRVSSKGVPFADRAVGSGDDTTMTVFLSPPLTAEANTPVELRIAGDIADDAMPGIFHARLAPAADFNAWDETSGLAVSATYTTSVDGGGVRVQGTATDVLARSTPALPAILPIGSRNVTALRATIRHPGGPETASVAGDTVVVRLRDEFRTALAPAQLVDGLRVLLDGVEVGSISDPTGGSESMLIPLAGFSIAPGDTADLTLMLDVEPTAPASGIELVIDASGLHVFDANLGNPVVVLADTGGELPLTSGLARLRPPADELVAKLVDHMPAVIAGGLDAQGVADLELANTATAEVGAILVESLAFRGANGDRETVPLGAGVLEIRLVVGEELWASSGELAAGDSIAVIALAAPLEIAPGESITVGLHVRFRERSAIKRFRIGLDRDDIGVVQPGGALLAVRVEPADGTVFPFWTEAGSFTGLGLDESYSNFPNPFSAGREATTFVYALERAATVTLRIYTARGERVITLLDRIELPAGLYQRDRWDGRNGRGVTVRNGVYVAVLEASFDDGRSERVRRKVAVVR